MNSSTQLVVSQQVNPDSPLNFEIPPTVKRAGDFVVSIGVGALSGYIFYWITRLIDKLGMLGEAGGSAIHPLPYILSGVVSAAMVEVAKLTYEASLHILGERDLYENLDYPENAPQFDRLRQHTWKVIGRVEKLQHNIDVIFSRIFDISSAKEIREKNIPDRDLYFMEISRRAFWEQIHETLSTAIPQELGVYLVEACGYAVLGGHLFIWLHGVIFLSGLIDKVGQVYHKIHSEEEQQKEREWENKKYCEVLAAMYPAEFEQLESRESGIKVGNSDTDDDFLIDDDGINGKSVDEHVNTFKDELQLDDLLDEDGSLMKEERGEEQLTGESEGMDDFDPLKDAGFFAYRHTISRSSTIKGFEERSDHSQIPEDEPLVMQEADVPADFILIEAE